MPLELMDRKMKKFCLLMFYLMISLAVFSENAFIIKKIDLDSMTMNLYVEAEYQLDGDMYVPLALCESNGVCSIENNTLKIVFYPRGNTIFRGDYSALRGNRVQKISSGDELVFRCHLGEVLYLSSMYDKNQKPLRWSDFYMFDVIEFTFCEVCFEPGQYIENDCLKPDWKGVKIYIKSKTVNLIKEDEWFKVSDE